MQGYSGMTKS